MELTPDYPLFGIDFTVQRRPADPLVEYVVDNLGANGGIGWSGALSSSSYALVLQSNP
jgi:hypothetical protein